MDLLNQHILKEISAIGIVARVIKHRQQSESWKTLSWYSRKLGLKSRSNLSEALKGIRSIKQEHWRPLLDLLELNQDQKEYVLTLVELERTRSRSTKENLLRALKDKRRILEGPLRPWPSQVKGMNLAHEVYCSFSLFQQKASREDLVSFFGRDRFVEVDQALHKLIKEGLVSFEEPFFRQCNPLDNRMLKLYAEDDKNAEVSYLKSAMDKARADIEKWYAKDDLCFFGSAVISVKRKTYEEALKLFKNYVLSKSLEMETEDADMLINFNIQIFPAAKVPD